MNHRLAVMLVIVLAVIPVAAPAAGVSAQQPAHDYYLALGDSLAAGQGASIPDQFGYAGLFVRHYRANHRGTVGFENLAVGGETSSSFLDGQLARALEEINDTGTEVQVLTLSIGANDFLPLLTTGPCATRPTGPACQQIVAGALIRFAVNYLEILNQLNAALARDPGAGRVLVTTYYNPFDGTGNPGEDPVALGLLGLDNTVDCNANIADLQNLGLNDIIFCVGRQFQAEVVDIYPLFDDSAPELTHINNGDIHPNNAGHRKIGYALIGVYRDG